MNIKRLCEIGAVTLGLSAAPLSAGSSVLAPVELTGACGQATRCHRSFAYICSTAIGDLMGYDCYEGCWNDQ